MTANKPLQMVMRDMLFITWAVEPDAARKLVDARFELDTITDSDSRTVALVSAVCFHVAEVRTSIVPLPNLSFQQVNYRIYVRNGDVPAVCFLEMKVNSRMVTAMTSFLNVPVFYEDIEITTTPSGSGALGYRMRSPGLQAEATIGQTDKETPGDARAPHQFITQRLVGYAAAGNGMYRIDVEQPGLDSISALIQNVKAPVLERIGLLTAEQSARPYSVLYVREGLFGADAPIREW
jgi:uncharacterized protein YqjF (DUF2071 family)